MAATAIATAYTVPIDIYSTQNATAATTVALVADTVSNVALNGATSNIDIKTAIEEIIYVKYKLAVGDADVSTTNYDDIILSVETGIDRGVYAATVNLVIEKTTHISILCALGGDVFVIER